MRTILIALAALAVAAAGCISAPADDAAMEAASAPDAAAQPAPVSHAWEGFVLASDAEGPTHVQPTEQVLWPTFKEGILFDVQELPQAMEVSLAWEGDGEFMIMLHSHKAHGTNAYVEHITEMDATNPKCLRVPAADLTEGKWQVMIHSNGATQVPFTLTTTLVGGAGAIVEGEFHGHWLQDGSFEVEEHEIEPCQLSPAAESAA